VFPLLPPRCIVYTQSIATIAAKLLQTNIITAVLVMMVILTYAQAALTTMFSAGVRDIG